MESNKKNARGALETLLRQYETRRGEVIKAGSAYNETQLRNDYLNPFLRLLGWDVDNQKGAPQHLREVVHEANVDVEENDELTTKNPDYALRVGSERKLFVEAKKPSVRIESSKEPAFQVRRYGWNAGMTVSVLSNFDKLAVYDCRYPPNAEDEAHVARVRIYDHTEYLERFDEIYELLSRDSVYEGSIEEHFPDDGTDAEKQSFDSYFLRQIESWREYVAVDLIRNNSSLDQDELNFLVQRLLNRIIFLRVCEDRDLETYEQLKGVTTYDGLKRLFLEADERYDSGLFDFIDDRLSLGIKVSAEVLITIFRELYFPNSPYNFAVVEAGILGQIYELFLGREILIGEAGSLKVAEKPEVVASSGVIPTPKYVVDEIVRRTLDPLCEGASLEEVAQIRICDVCCGSGVFLLAVFEYLLNHYRERYIAQGQQRDAEKIYEGEGHTWHLTLPEKRRILLNSIYGVDIDPQAVEVAKFSLLLKVLEGESTAAVDAYLKKGLRALPNLKNNIKCGNSLVDRGYFGLFHEALTDDTLLRQVNPFDWDDEFPHVAASGGFDAIVGNPPYIRIQNMVRYSPSEIDYYRSDEAGYQTAGRDNFDKYYLFIERSMKLLKAGGLLGYIVPHKFFTIKGGKQLRRTITQGDHLHEIVHFGVEQIFPGRSTYTAILILRNEARSEFTVERVGDVDAWRVTKQSPRIEYEAEEVSEEPWVFVSREARAAFQKMKRGRHQRLDAVANIFVGLQTSADAVYIIRPNEILEKGDHIVFKKSGRRWEVEASILEPCLYDAILRPFSQVQANAEIIFPYRIQSGRAVLYSESEMNKHYPLCWQYLLEHKDQLEARSITGGKTVRWYQYGRSQSLTKFDGQEKLIWSVLALDAPYAFDGRNIMFTGGGNGPYYSLRPKNSSAVSIYYLLAVLSHPVVEAMVKVRSSAFRGGYYSHGKQFIRNLPIRTIDEKDAKQRTMYRRIVEDSREHIKVQGKLLVERVPTRRRLLETQRTTLRGRIQDAVTQLYGLDQEDLVAVRPENLYFATSTVEE